MFSASGQQVFRILRNLKLSCPIYNRWPLVSRHSQINPVHALLSYYFKIHFSIIVASTPASFRLSIYSPVDIYLMSLPATCPANLILLDFSP